MAVNPEICVASALGEIVFASLYSDILSASGSGLAKHVLTCTCRATHTYLPLLSVASIQGHPVVEQGEREGGVV